jgi:hypothetical protein
MMVFKNLKRCSQQELGMMLYSLYNEATITIVENHLHKVNAPDAEIKEVLITLISNAFNKNCEKEGVANTKIEIKKDVRWYKVNFDTYEGVHQIDLQTHSLRDAYNLAYSMGLAVIEES